MLAVKRLCDLHRSQNHSDRTGGGTLQRKLPAALELVAIEHNIHSQIQFHNPNGGYTSPQIARALLSFQDSELSAELQNAMTGIAGDSDIRGRASAAMSISQESISIRSRGSGNSNTGNPHNPQSLSSSGNASSNTERIVGIGEGEQVQCSGSGSRDRGLQRPTEMWQSQSQSITSDKVPLPSLISPKSSNKMSHFVYPAVLPMCKHIHWPNCLYQPYYHSPSSSSSPSPHPTPKTYTYIHTYEASAGEAPSMQPNKLCETVDMLEPQHGQNPTNYDPRGPHKNQTLGLSRFTLSDGEDDDLTTSCITSSAVIMPSYATFSRKARSGHTNPTGVQRHLNPSHSFALRPQCKGPPPRPPKRLSSVSGIPCQTEKIKTDVNGGLEALNIDSVLNIAVRLEGNSRNSCPSRRIDIPPTNILVPPVPSAFFSSVPHGKIPYVKPVPGEQSLGTLRKTVSERKEDESLSQKFGDAALKNKSEITTDSPNHKCKCQLPFAGEDVLTIKQGTRTAAELTTALEGPALNLKSVTLPVFNLKESDTVKRRHKLKHPLTSEEGLDPNRESNQPQMSSLYGHTSHTLSEKESEPIETVFCSLGKGPKPEISSKLISPHEQSFKSNPVTPQIISSVFLSNAQTAIPNLTNIQIHTVSPKIGGNTRAQTSTSVLNPLKHVTTFLPQMETFTSVPDLMGSQSSSAIEKGDQLLFWGFICF